MSADGFEIELPYIKILLPGPEVILYMIILTRTPNDLRSMIVEEDLVEVTGITFPWALPGLEQRIIIAHTIEIVSPLN